MPVTHYPRPGLSFWRSRPAVGTALPVQLEARGQLFAVIDGGVFYIDRTSTSPTSAVVDAGAHACSIADNSTNPSWLMVRRGLQYFTGAARRADHQIGDPNFMGSTRADFLDTSSSSTSPAPISGTARCRTRSRSTRSISDRNRVAG